MASQRPWFRLPTLARPTTPAPAAPTPEPEPRPAPPRPILIRPPFRPTAQAQPPPPPPATTLPPPVTASQPAPGPPSAGTASVPSSPIIRPTSGFVSVPTSPAPRASAPASSLPPSPAPTATALPVTTSLPPSPKPAVSASTYSLPPSPAPKPALVSSSVPTSSTAKPIPSTSSVPTSPARNAVTTSTTHVPSPRTIKPASQTPPQSPKPKPTAPPPSPLTLPPSQVKSDEIPEPRILVETEQKAVLVQKTIDRPKAWMNSSESKRDFADALNSSIANRAKKEPSKDVERKERGHRKKVSSSDSEEVAMRVITISGENKGAFMEMVRSPKENALRSSSSFLHKKGHLNSKVNEWGSHSSSSSGEEGNSKKKDKSHEGKATGSPSMGTFMNSNVQGVNNSIVYNSSCTHHDPGVRLSLSRKPAGAGFHVKDRVNG